MCRKLSCVFFLIIALSFAYVTTVESGTGTYVTYFMPYLHTDTNNPVYCVVTNFGIGADNITSLSLNVMSAETSTFNRYFTSLESTNLLNYGRTVMLTFSGQNMYVGTSTSNKVDISTLVGTSEVYGAKLTFISTIQKDSNALRTSHLNCKNIPMACFMGTSNPKRNMEGTICEAGYVINSQALYQNQPYDAQPDANGNAVFTTGMYWADNTTGLSF
ncbi:hypothetical protein [Candidatus Magnetomonas plexicatena]|uniref:hypothetical protein n=1 Tax=Candidatus Magnetomonas plexicatena TaxID=2552947 RepID=UPI001102DFB4|nr:hypothetical protein E2O03_001185 [Nitrospirales bacterium LBB_01]